MKSESRNAIKRAKRLVIGVAQDICVTPLALSSLVSPRRSNLWCFGACEGQRYADHSRMLFEEIRAKHPDIDVFWSTRSPAVYAGLKRRGLPVVMANSFRGLRATLRAGVCVYTHYALDHNAPAALGAYRVQLWHGIPLKRFQADNNLRQLVPRGRLKGLYGWLRTLRTKIFVWKEPGWDLIVFQSDLDRRRTGSAFRGQFTDGRVLGSIRAEWLTRKRASIASNSVHTSEAIQVLYAPTHRKLGEGRLFESVPVPPASELSRLLEKYGVFMRVRLHPLQAHEALPDGLSATRVCVAENAICSDIYESLTECDVIITDYSSIYIDALSIGIPIVCLAPDRHSYASEDQGFYSGIEEFPGPVTDTWEEALSECEKLTRDGGAAWRQQYADALNFYYGSQVTHDNNAMARTIDVIQSSIAGKRQLATQEH